MAPHKTGMILWLSQEGNQQLKHKFFVPYKNLNQQDIVCKLQQVGLKKKKVCFNEQLTHAFVKNFFYNLFKGIAQCH